VLLRNLPLKLAAIAVAIFLWFWVTMAQRASQPAGVYATAPGVSMVAARTVPVVLETEGSPPPGVRARGAQVEPPLVTVMGSGLRLAEVREIHTEPLDLARATASFSTELGLLVPRGVELPNKATVTVRVTLERAEPTPAPGPAERGAVGE